SHGSRTRIDRVAFQLETSLAHEADRSGRASYLELEMIAAAQERRKIRSRSCGAFVMWRNPDRVRRGKDEISPVFRHVLRHRQQLRWARDCASRIKDGQQQQLTH